MDLQVLSDSITLLKDVISAITGVVLTVIAILGLQAWKKQLKGKSEYETARRLLRSVYKVRDAISDMRNPIVTIGEVTETAREGNIEISFDIQNFAQRQSLVYQRRWNKIRESVTELEIEAFEAEVLWGKNVREKLKPLWKNIEDLRAIFTLYIQTLQDDEVPMTDESEKKIDDILLNKDSFVKGKSRNVFSEQLLRSIRQIERFIKPRMKL